MASTDPQIHSVSPNKHPYTSTWTLNAFDRDLCFRWDRMCGNDELVSCIWSLSMLTRSWIIILVIREAAEPRWKFTEKIQSADHLLRTVFTGFVCHCQCHDSDFSVHRSSKNLPENLSRNISEWIWKVLTDVSDWRRTFASLTCGL
jgi:hypothetical protein